MSERGQASSRRESGLARRLARLFRIERNGGFGRWPVAIVRKVVERRGALIEALMTIDSNRHSIAAPPSEELDAALDDLSRESEHALNRARKQLEQISNDLRLSRGEGLATGIRTTTGGHTLGTT